ncbi:TetR/AcrR family transcriptional regulator [Streptomyces sp. NPDC088246]|uniref:TetR/AcrR family transcriptional regulator n=1 Tax=Streptomyces sp. NPDC088246 TaxID=3365842 RepID=UPI0037F3B509
MRRTREDMARTAARLFLTQGYERTTVDQIADAAEVPQRTVFRHFPAKEDLVLAPLNASGDALVTALRSRPEEESPMRAMRAAFGAVGPPHSAGGRRIRCRCVAASADRPDAEPERRTAAPRLRS